MPRCAPTRATPSAPNSPRFDPPPSLDGKRESSWIARRSTLTSPDPSPRQHPDVYLDKKHPWLGEGVPYVDRIKYAETQKEKKRGFGTSDFSKRDEFSMDFRTNQYKEALKSENRHTAAATAKAYKEMQAAMEAELAAGGSPARSAPPPKDKPLLFDLVFDEAQRPTAVPNSMISGRESKNPTQCSWERNYGQTRTSSMDFGYGIEQAPHGKPQFARMPVLEATVYRPCAIPITQNTTVFTKRPN